ncbi:MAG: NUDIX hydrolase [Deltaproteobacteria bacterium]|jgi:ADP-ribose pyrophosphatase|nr:NUDIX hydrolase [Deltaproteobacteria bacterium]
MSAVINNSLTLHEGRVFNLIKENYTLDNGVTSEMDFIQHPGAAAMVPMLNATDVILIKQYRHAIREFIWEIPAGTLDPDESPLNCAQRELIEETGYSAAGWHQLGTITPLPGCSDERIHIFLASDLKAAEQNLDEDEMLKVHRLKLRDALQMVVAGEIADGKTISGLFLAASWLKNHS